MKVGTKVVHPNTQKLGKVVNSIKISPRDHNYNSTHKLLVSWDDKLPFMPNNPDKMIKLEEKKQIDLNYDGPAKKLIDDIEEKKTQTKFRMDNPKSNTGVNAAEAPTLNAGGGRRRRTRRSGKRKEKKSGKSMRSKGKRVRNRSRVKQSRRSRRRGKRSKRSKGKC